LRLRQLLQLHPPPFRPHQRLRRLLLLRHLLSKRRQSRPRSLLLRLPRNLRLRLLQNQLRSLLPKPLQNPQRRRRPLMQSQPF
jgi:hypothetical protein